MTHCLVSSSEGIPVLKPTAPNKRLYLCGGDETRELERKIKVCLNLPDEASRKLPLIIDLTHVAYVDTNGLGALFSGMHDYQRRQRKFALVLNDEKIKNIFTLTKLYLAFETFETLEAATAALLGDAAKT